MAHFIEDAAGWRMLILGGQIMDLPALPIDDTHAIVQFDRPIKEHAELVVKAGIPHHAMTVRGDVRAELHQLAALMGMETTSI